MIEWFIFQILWAKVSFDTFKVKIDIFLSPDNSLKVCTANLQLAVNLSIFLDSFLLKIHTLSFQGCEISIDIPCKTASLNKTTCI